MYCTTGLPVCIRRRVSTLASGFLLALMFLNCVDATELEVLRVAKLANHDQSNTHRDTAVETQMLQDAAASLGRKLQWISLDTPFELRESLLTRSADIYVSPLPLVTDDKISDATIASLAPIGFERYRVVAPDDSGLANPLDLAGKKIAVKFSSPVLPYLRQLRETLTGLRLVVLPDNMPRKILLNKLNDGSLDAAVIATNFRTNHLARFPDLKFQFDLTTLHPVSWKVHAENTTLITQINKFLQRYHASYIEQSIQNTDTDDQVIRAIAELDKNYVVRNGQPIGFEYDLIKRFAKVNDLRLDILVARDENEVSRWIKEGIGDIVMSQMTERSNLSGQFAMSREYRHDIPVVISVVTNEVSNLGDLESKKIAVMARSNHSESLKALNDEVQIITMDARTPIGDAIADLRNGEFDGLVVSAKRVPKMLKANSDLRAGLSLPTRERFRWAVRTENTDLRASVENFLRQQYRSTDYNILAKRYEESQVASTENQISPYDKLIKTYAEQYDFDWRLIAAQIYQESRFDPTAVSSAGARGLMQIMPATASDLGLSNPEAPEASIHAGIKYLDYLRDRFEADVPQSERLWMALAAYNIGFERVKRARGLATSLGLNANRWFDNVEIAMRQMTQPNSPVRGCRCGQAIVYVRAIRSLYSAYRYVGAA
jgi:membrane-bound lytic murein transglycosylase F